MIGYYTDNSVSRSVMKALSRGGLKVTHINNFQFNKNTPAVFYGILRGTGAAMRHLQYLGKDFHYIDNGYFDAVYMDEFKNKDMSGKYRVVRGDMIEPMDIQPIKTELAPLRVLVMPPSAYTAFMYDTTPEDWVIHNTRLISDCGHMWKLRDKEEREPLSEVLEDFDAVFAFNSIGVIQAIDMGKAVYTTHGIIRNANMISDCAPYYSIHDIKDFYSKKQFTLEELARDGIKCLN